MAQLWRPQRGPQTEALNSEAFYLYYGGQAGGGKSDLGLGAAFTQHNRSIIFRREYPQLTDLVDRSREIAAGLKRFHAACGGRDYSRLAFNGQQYIWRGLPNGGKIEFGACAREDDVKRWKGRPHDLKVFDEGVDWTELMFRFISGWTRSVVPGQRCRVMLLGNPPTTTEGEWVIQFWAPWLDPQHGNPALPGELRWYTTIGGEDHECEDGSPITFDGQILQPRSRTFIPASMESNVFLSSTDYASTLQGLPEPLRSQLLFGDFRAGARADPWQVFPTAWVVAAQERWKATPRPMVPMTALGVDPSLGGNQMAMAPRYANYVDELRFAEVAVASAENPTVAAAALLLQHRLDNAVAMIDVGGIGASVYHMARTMLRKRTPNADRLLAPYNGSLPALGPDGKHAMTDRSGQLPFVNIRAAAHWQLREALDPASGEDVCLPPDPMLRKELTSVKWNVGLRGIQVEPKENVAKRVGHSPDRADAVVMACFAQTKKATGGPTAGGDRAKRVPQELTPDHQWR